MQDFLISFQIFFNNIIALILNEIRIRFITTINMRRSRAYMAVIFEPLMHVGLWIVVRGMFFPKIVSESIALPVFLLLGTLPWICINSMISRYSQIIIGRKNLMCFSLIKPIDLIVSAFSLEIIINIVTLFISLYLLRILGVNWTLAYPTYFFVNYAFFLLLVFGVFLTIAVGAFYMKRFDRVALFSIRFLYFFSGVFYSIAQIPKQYRYYFSLNPLFQVIDIMRRSFEQNPAPLNYSDPLYLAKCAFVSFFIGILFYYFSRKKILMEINQR